MLDYYSLYLSDKNFRDAKNMNQQLEIQKLRAELEKFKAELALLRPPKRDSDEDIYGVHAVALVSSYRYWVHKRTAVAYGATYLDTDPATLENEELAARKELLGYIKSLYKY